MRRAAPLVVVLVLAVATAVGSQQSPVVARSQAAYEELDYGGAISAAREALQQPLTGEDRIIAYELLGFSYAALDSTRQAIEAFERLVFLAPDREPDVERVSPRITSLYALALGRVLVVRRVRMDSASFIASQGSVPIRFELSRTARVEARVLGAGIDVIVDTQTVAGAVVVQWTALLPDGRPLPAGRYQLLIEAREGDRSAHTSRPLGLLVEHGSVDTLPHLETLPDHPELPETVTPGRDWKPLLLTAVIGGLTTLTMVQALDQSTMGSGGTTGVLVVGAATVGTGLVVSLRKPDPRPVPTNVLYNQVVRELLARRNAEIAGENIRRRQSVLLTVGAAP